MAKIRNPIISESMQISLKPVYSMSAVKRDIVLYEGDIELDQEAKLFSGVGAVQFRWLPRPGLRFSFDVASKSRQMPRLEDSKLHLMGINWHANVSVLGLSISKRLDSLFL